MTTRILTALLFLAATLAAGTAQAQFGAGFSGGQLTRIVNSELIAIGGSCYVRDTFANGTVREIPCDELDYEDVDDFGEDDWDDFCDTWGRFLSPAQYAEYCGESGGYNIRLSDSIAFSNFRLHFNANYLATGTFSRGFLATEPTPGTLLNPAYSLDYSLSGYKAKLGLDATLSYDRFSPLKISAGLEFGSLSGAGSASGIALDNFGVPSVGVDPGTFANWPTDVLRTDFTVDRDFGTLSTRVSFPLMKGAYSFAGTSLGNSVSGLDYDLYAIVGKRLGWLSQSEQTLIETDTPAFGVNSLSQIEYNTQFDGGFFGLQAGLGLDKRMPLLGRDDIAIQESFSFLLGYDYYQLRVSDSVDANLLNGLATQVSSNSFNVGAGVPTLQTMASIGIGNGKWYAGIRGGISAGLYPEFDYNRPDSTAGGDPLEPTLQLNPGLGYELGADFKYRF